MTDTRPPRPLRPQAACVLCPCRWRRDQWHWRLADPGYRTCSACSDRLGEWLREIRDLYAELDASPILGEYGHRGGFGPRSPARDDVIALTDRRNRAAVDPSDRPSVPGVLRAWVQEVRDERQLTTALPVAGDVLGDVAVLLANLTWITRQEWVAELELELDELRTAVRAAARVTDHRRRPPDGRCPKCTRPLWAPVDGRTIHCRCGEQYDRRDWPKLRVPATA